MATYAAVVSLMNTMDAVMNDPRLSTCFHKQQIQSLGENLDILLQFIENYNYNSLGRDDGAQSLERRITSVAHRAEDVIESHIVAQIHAGVLEDASASSIDLHQIMHDIDEIKEEVVKVNVEKMGSNNLQKPKNSPQPLPTGKMTMIGFDDYLLQLLDGLTGYESGRQVIPVVGMGGAGKTTLTKNAYENSLIVHHFDVRAWVSISQQYDVKDILVQLLSSLGQSADKNNEFDELIERLHKYFYGRRYLVVLDDMWSITAWEKLQFCFPENSNGSRIIVTTRLLEVANAFGSSGEVRVGLLDDNKSWDLFCDRAFAQQSCPNELEKIGKAIVKKCKGLPLSIVVIGALLGKSSQAREHWENVAENMSSSLSSSDDILDILCLSYNHLPAHLKPCFLYLGTFKEDDEVSVSKLVKLWIAEGFIKPDKEQMLEEVAEGYMYDLLERSLILVDSLGWNKKFSSFRIHDLVRDLCLREAYKEKFFIVISTMVDEVEAERCIVYSFQEYSTRLRSTAARSIICNMYYPPELLIGSTLLRVCAAKSVSFHEKDEFLGCLQNVNMRFISCRIYGKGFAIELLRSIFLLWNLQTLIIYVPGIIFEAPVEIWKMRQLRHVEFNLITLPEPPLSEEEDEFVVLHNLQTLEEVENLRCSEDVCKRIPNIKRLGLYYRDFSKYSNEYCLQNVGRLNKLESLSLKFYIEPVLGDLLRNLTLPTSLKELSLFNSNLDWNDLGIIGSLPNLELLKISQYATVREWKCVEGQFLALKHLMIVGCHINRWIVESCHFPVLDTLTLNNVTLYGEIPLGIGEIPTLRKIYVITSLDFSTALSISAMKLLKEQEDLGNDDLLQLQLHIQRKKLLKEQEDSTALSISAMKLLKEQEDLGNDLLQLQLHFEGVKLAERFLEKVEKEGLTCTNFTCVISLYEQHGFNRPHNFCNETVKGEYIGNDLLQLHFHTEKIAEK